MTTPAAELRDAADKIRKLAADASIDPHSNRPTNTWHFQTKKPEFPTDFPPHGRLVAPDADGHNRRLIHGRAGGTRAHAPWMFESHGTYIAAMGPGVGTALADWLDQAAHHYECGIRAADDVFHDDPAGREAFLTTGPGAPSAHALAVARAILGTPDGQP